jgi:hypothetical protein
METQDQEQIAVLRVAKNEGLDEQMLLDLNRIAQLITKTISIGLFRSSLAFYFNL